MIDELIKIFSRDLDRLRNELQLFQHEANLWRTTGSVKNSAGNLSLHLIGNLNTYIGKNIGGSGYIRDRDAEFSLKDVSRTTLLQHIEETKATISTSLRLLTPEQLDAQYVEPVLGFEMTNSFFLVHLAAHFSYHLGQINYLRRILEPSLTSSTQQP